MRFQTQMVKMATPFCLWKQRISVLFKVWKVSRKKSSLSAERFDKMSKVERIANGKI